jgi:FOG: Ankyrin repeat
MYGREPESSLDTLPAEIIHEIADCIPTEKEVVDLMVTNLRLHHHLKVYLCHRNMKNGNTGIFWACQNGQVEACLRFLELGADPNSESTVGGYTLRRLLNIAAYGGHIECAQVLLIHGADPNAKDGSGDTPLFPAIQNRDAPMVQMLLEMQADPTVKNERRYPPSPLDMANGLDLGYIVKLHLNSVARLSD